jgi:tRNA dimethylallyltransferase
LRLWLVADEPAPTASRVTKPRAILIAGPTASGKSAVAAALAARIGAAIVNTDSMQVYRDLRIITARPSAEEEARYPHRLYGHIDAAVNYSVAKYLADAERVLAETAAQGVVPIFVGGTGLYFRALTRGLSAIPPVPAEVRGAVRARLAEEGPAVLHDELRRHDEAVAARLNPADRVRVARALEVVLATGRSIDIWHRMQGAPLIAPDDAVKIYLATDRAELYARIDRRFDAMLGAGALEEVAALAARKLDPLLPAMKAHGVPWLVRHLSGAIALDEAVRQAKLDTRHYAKRQDTWFRHQFADWTRVAPEAAVDDVLRGRFA